MHETLLDVTQGKAAGLLATASPSPRLAVSAAVCRAAGREGWERAVGGRTGGAKMLGHDRVWPGVGPGLAQGLARGLARGWPAFAPGLAGGLDPRRGDPAAWGGALRRPPPEDRGNTEGRDGRARVAPWLVSHKGPWRRHRSRPWGALPSERATPKLRRSKPNGAARGRTGR